MFGRNADEGMLRSNPQINAGNIASLVGGVRTNWETQGITARLDVDAEVGLSSPVQGGFAQTSIDGTIRFPVMRNHAFRSDLHLLTTIAGPAPRQRWNWVGGSGTLSTIPLLSLGGDQAFVLENRYEIPIERINLPFLGNPSFALRHILAGAQVGGFPRLHQGVGARLSVRFFRVDLMVMPEERRAELGFGVALSR
jgi:hypothetical protein